MMDKDILLMRQEAKTPIYIKITEHLKNKITSRQLIPGDMLPGEIEFAKELSVTRQTLRKSLKILEDEGFILRKKSAGTVIAPYDEHERPPQYDIAYVMLNKDDYSYDAVMYSGLGNHIIRLLARQGHLLRLIPWDVKKPGYCMDDIVNEKGIDGFIFPSPCMLRDFITVVAEARIPHVVFETDLGIPRANTVMLDDFQAAYDSVRYFVGNGYKRIGFVGGELKAEKHMSASRRRLNGFRKACRDFGITPDKDWLIYSEESMDENLQDNSYIREKISGNFSKNSYPEAVVLGMYYSAEQFLTAEKDFNISQDRIAKLTISGSCLERNIMEKVRQLPGFYYEESLLAQKGVESLTRWLKRPQLRPKSQYLKMNFDNKDS
jgi:DNA-binding transcriptional regulator YhcF (GntR family)